MPEGNTTKTSCLSDLEDALPDLTKEQVLHLIKLYESWLKDDDPEKEFPEELEITRGTEMGILAFLLWSVLHLFWLGLHIFFAAASRLALRFGLNRMAIWTARKRIQFDNRCIEPVTTNLNWALTQLGVAYLQSGRVDCAIECLQNSWRIYPDYTYAYSPFGMSMRLCKKLSEYPEADAAVLEYTMMRRRFRTR
ncbi:hypothetical protein ACFL1X_07255 [Candidatus Hydrogenedentota bacterium]